MKRIVMFAVLLFASATSLQAQGRENDRAGLWGAVGLGYGSLSCGSCDGREGGFSGNGKIGGTLSRQFRLAAGTNGFYKSSDGVTTKGGAFTGQVLWFPGGNDFYLVGGAGYGWFEVSADVQGFSISSDDGGLGLVLGAGYDFPINQSGSLAISPFFNWVFTSAGNDIEFFQLGASLTFN